MIESEDERVVRQRTGPAIYVVDEDCRVVLGWSSEEPGQSRQGPGLPEEIERAVRELQWAIREGAQTPLVRLLDSSFVVRVATVTGALGTYTAVLVERFRSRDRASGGSRGYALTQRELDVLKHVADAARPAEIARDLDMAPSMVSTDLKSILGKASSRTRADMFGRIIAQATDGASNGTPAADDAD